MGLIKGDTGSLDYSSSARALPQKSAFKGCNFSHQLGLELQ